MEQHAQVSRSSEDERRPLLPQNERRPLLPQNEEQALRFPIKKRRINKSATIAILILIVAAVLISIVGFVLPKMAQRYIEETIEVDVSDMKVLRLTETGADAQANLTMSLEASRSTLGSFQRRIADKLVALAGTARLSDIAVRGYVLHDGQHHVLDVKPEDFALKLGGDTQSRTTIKAHVKLLHTKPISDLASVILNKQIKKVSGRIHVSTTIHKLLTMRRSIKKTLHYTLPDALDGDLPPFNISQLDVKDGNFKGLTGSALLKVLLQSPVDLDVPSVSVDVLIDGCERDKILLATGHNAPLHLDTKAKSIQVKAMGKIEHLPKEAMVMCLETRCSPLDRLMQLYLAGNETRVYIRGSAPIQGDSSWLQRIASRVMLPIDLPGSQTDQLARDIELADVKFNIGGFFRQEKPKISGNIKATIDIPEGIDVKVDINSVKLLADLIFKGRKFATMASPDWSPASSTFVETTELHVQAQLRDVPVTITDNEVFSSVVSALLGGNVLMDVAGTVDVKVRTGLGELQPRGLPLVAKGIEIGGFAGGLPSTLKAAVQNLGVVGTTPESLELAAQVSIQNPTPYGGVVQAANVLMVYNGSVIGSLTGRNVKLEPKGNVTVDALLRYDPHFHGNPQENQAAFSELLSLYLSELPVNLTLRAHKKSIPGMPNLSKALAHLPLEVTLPIPQLQFPDDEGRTASERPTMRHGSRFLVSAKFHVLSSTAQFTLRNPLNESVIITELEAQARYHENEVGVIEYTYPVTLAGDRPTTETSRLPVSWSLPPSDILRKAFRGTLKVNATALCKVSIGELWPLPLSLEVLEVGAGVGI